MSPGAVEPPAARGFEELARFHEPALLAIAMRLCRNPADARDLVQDTFEQGLKSFAALRPDSNVRAWLITIQHNKFIDRCRRGRRVTMEPLGREAEVAAPEPCEAPAWASITGEELRAALAGLEPGFRDVYQLHAIDGKSYQEIADALGIPKATVGTRLLRARKKLRELLTARRDDGADDDDVGGEP